ncbi:MAG: site-specific DNA-methyltransferase, partial [Planctomycetales bacterium]
MSLPVNAVHVMDCVEGLKQLRAGSVHLAFADPPFNIGYDYDAYQDDRGYQEYCDWAREWMGAASRVLRDDGSFWIAIGDEYAAETKIIACRDLGLRCRSWVVWYYTFGVNCTRKFNRSHVHLFHFVKDAE